MSVFQINFVQQNSNCTVLNLRSVTPLTYYNIFNLFIKRCLGEKSLILNISGHICRFEDFPLSKTKMNYDHGQLVEFFFHFDSK